MNGMNRILVTLLVVWLAGCGRRTATPSLAPAVQSNERSTIGNGSDILDGVSGSAWFTGNRVVRYCVRTSDKFGLDSDTVKGAIREAFRTWRNYITYKHLEDSRFYPERNVIPQPPRISTDSLELATCDGSEDLTFFLGISSAAITRDRAHFQNPVAFAVRQANFLDQGWSKGYIHLAESHAEIGIAPNWSGRKDALKLFVTHELGHVLGCGHVDGTVMAADSRYLLRGVRRIAAAAAGAVDFERDLLLCPSCASQEIAMTGKALVETHPESPGVPVLARIFDARNPLVMFDFPIVIGTEFAPLGFRGFFFSYVDSFSVNHGGDPIFRVAYKTDGVVRVVQSFSEGIVSTGNFWGSYGLNSGQTPFRPRAAILTQNGKKAYFSLHVAPFRPGEVFVVQR